jgi:hypothetical protein
MPLSRIAAVIGAACALSVVVPAVSAAPAAAAGHITYSVGSGPLLRVEARAGARPQDVSAGLDRRFPGAGDQFLNQSPDGRWLVLQSERFGCAGNPCLAVVSSNLRSGQSVRRGTVHAEGFSAVGDGGRVVVWPAQSRGGRVDLFASRRTRGGWSRPRNVTARSAKKIHGHPAISTDATRVLHDCGDASDPSAGSLSVCESRLDGKGTRVRVRPSDGRRPVDGVFGAGSLHHADYLGRGLGLVFESQWCCQGESIWWLQKGKRKPRHVRGASPNNVAPCGLPDGRVVSLDLSRPAGGGVHELMITTPTSKKKTFVLAPGVDVNDIGIGCGR